MMRYQRISPDCLPLSNGRKSNLRACKEDDGDNGRISNFSTSFEGKALRFRSGATPSNSQDHKSSPQFVDPDSPQSDNNATSKKQSLESSSSSPNRGGGGSDILLQWGQNKRSRGSRTDNRVMTDESLQARQVIKIHRRVVSNGVVDKQLMMNQTATMPPPPPPPLCTGTSYSRGGNLRPSISVRECTSSPINNRNMEERSGMSNKSPSRSNNNNGGSSSSTRVVSRSSIDRRSPPSAEKIDKTISSSGTAATAVPGEKVNGSVAQADDLPTLNDVESSLVPSPSEQGGGGGERATPTPNQNPNGVVMGEKVNLDLFEWPRIYISLSRKEKEDDFLAMKGTKLPQRPKKRAKNVDKTLQFCFPGMWLSDLTRGRYEVREKKCVKKKRRGLKGMESMDSDSE